MDYSKPGFWAAICLGGFIIGIASLIQQYSTKDPRESIRFRAIFRDFFIGAFLTASAYMFLPESIDSLTSSFFNALPTSTQSGGNSTTSGTSGTSGTSDIELQFGPARF